jgi:predicted enzyme related to lactoylglutathione lyase
MLPTEDLDRAIAFYERALALTVITRKRYGEHFENAYLGTGASGVTLELATSGARGSRDPRAGHVAFGTDEIESVCARVLAAGGAVLRAPAVSAATKVVYAYVADPDGNVIELVSRPTPRA